MKLVISNNKLNMKNVEERVINNNVKKVYTLSDIGKWLNYGFYKTKKTTSRRRWFLTNYNLAGILIV